MELLQNLMDLVLHVDVHLNHWMALLGPWIYVLLFLIVFCETGLVVTPFLPGDSLLFALGALAAVEDSTLEVKTLAIVLIVAGILGDAVNYSIGKWLGPKVFRETGNRWLKREYLLKTEEFYERHGGKTIILARFMPIIRTFAPFVAGIGRMSYPRFAMFNVSGAVVWVLSFLLAGYFFGGLPIIKQNFHIVILAIVVISFLPGVIEWVRASRKPATPLRKAE